MEPGITTSPRWSSTTKLLVGLVVVGIVAFLFVRFTSLITPLLMVFILAYLLNQNIRGRGFFLRLLFDIESGKYRARHEVVGNAYIQAVAKTAPDLRRFQFTRGLPVNIVVEPEIFCVSQKCSLFEGFDPETVVGKLSAWGDHER